MAGQRSRSSYIVVQHATMQAAPTYKLLMRTRTLFSDFDASVENELRPLAVPRATLSRRSSEKGSVKDTSDLLRVRCCSVTIQKEVAALE